MQLVLISRSFPLSATRSLRVDLLQDTDTLAKVWEVTFVVRTSKGATLGSITRRKTRTEAMRIVRRALHPA